MKSFAWTLSTLNRSAALTVLQMLLTRASCLFLGHQVNNRIFSGRRSITRQCECGIEYLRPDGPETRVRHNISCFLFGHHYKIMGFRSGHYEYGCEVCGHPLLLLPDSPNARQASFRKQVRYFCNLLGHRVHLVGERAGMTEYACHCGHNFFKEERDRTKITHPLICFFAGHYLTHIARRCEADEYYCRNCGHPFYFF